LKIRIIYFLFYLGLRLIVEPSMTEIENIDLLKNILNAEIDEIKKFKLI